MYITITIPTDTYFVAAFKSFIRGIVLCTEHEEGSTLDAFYFNFW